jgi:hypothetical protein
MEYITSFLYVSRDFGFVITSRDFNVFFDEKTVRILTFVHIFLILSLNPGTYGVHIVDKGFSVVLSDVWGFFFYYLNYC